MLYKLHRMDLGQKLTFRSKLKTPIRKTEYYKKSMIFTV